MPKGDFIKMTSFGYVSILQFSVNVIGTSVTIKVRKGQSSGIVLMGKRELVALLFNMPWVCLHFMIVVFPDHTQLLLSIQSSTTPDPGYHMGKVTKTIKHHN